MCTCSVRSFIACGIINLILCIAFIVLAYYMPVVLHNALIQQVLQQQRLVNSNSSQGFPRWQSSDFPGAPQEFFYVYAFNITNIPEVLSGEKPKLQQIGPYVYVWKWYMFDIEWLAGGNLVDFNKFESFTFSKQETDKLNNNSNLDPKKDVCNFPYVAYAGFRSKLADTGADTWYQALGMDLLAAIAGHNQSNTNLGPFITTTVHEYVFSFHSDLLEWANQTFGSLNLIPGAINPIVSLQQNDTSKEGARERVNFTRNGMRTGNNDITQLNQYYKFRGMTDLGIWGTADANNVRGSDGLGFQVDIQNQPNLLIFVDNLVRHVNFVSNMTMDVKGIPTDLYFLDQNEFNNYPHNPYYLNFPSGVSNLTAVNILEQGAPVPILASQPHFFSADPYYANQVIFLPPNNVTDVNLHNTFLYVEPNTGITFKANKRIQVNLLVQPSFMTYPNITPTWIPAVWFEETSEITDEQAQQWKDSVELVLQWKQYSPVILFCLGGIFLLVCGSLFFRAYTLHYPTQDYSPINE